MTDEISSEVFRTGGTVVDGRVYPSGKAPIPVKIVRLREEASLPLRSTPGSAGFDLAACCISESGRPLKKVLSTRTTTLISTGLAIQPPPGYTILVCSRSGLATKSLFVANAPGVIDPDYTGEVKILMYNGGFEHAWIEHGQRIAQFLLLATPNFHFTEVVELTETERGGRGIGSTGT